MPHYDSDWDYQDDPEIPDWEDDNGDAALERCPHCRQWIYEDAEQCPACGQYIEDRTGVSSRPRWVLAVASILLCLILGYWIWRPWLGW